MDNQVISKHISHTKSFNISVSIALTTLAHILNGYMSQYNKLSDFQYPRFQILVVHLHFGLFWLAGMHPVIIGL